MTVAILPQNPIGDAAHAAACQLFPGPCAVNGTAHAAGGAVTSAAGNAVLQPVADAFKESAGHALTWSLGLFTQVSPDVDGSTSGINAVRGSLTYIISAIAVACLIVAGAKMAWSKDSRPVMGAFRGLALMVLVTGASVAVYSILAHASSAYAQWIVKGASEGNAEAGVTKMVSGLGAAGVGLTILFAFVAIFVSLGLIFTAVVRGAIAIILLAFMPAIAATTIIDAGMIHFKRVCSWLFACAIWPMVAGSIYAVALATFPTAQDGKAVAEALAVMLLACLALPATMRLAAPISAMGGGGGGALAAAGGAVFATGAKMVSQHSASSTGTPTRSATANAPTGPSGAANAAPAPSGSNGAAGVWTSPRTPATASGASAAGGPAGAAIQGAVILTKAAKGAATQAAGEGTK
jgi:hypothetical protein